MKAREPADETGLALFRRLGLRPFELRWTERSIAKSEVMAVGELLELQGKDTAETLVIVLNAVLQFINQYADGVMIHVSTGHSLRLNIKQSSSSFPGLKKANEEGRLKSVCVQNIHDLMKCIARIESSIRDTMCLVVFEGLTPLLLQQMPPGDSSSEVPAATDALLQRLNDLQESCCVLSLWVSTHVPAGQGGLREGKGPVVALWRQRLRRRLILSPDRGVQDMSTF